MEPGYIVIIILSSLAAIIIAFLIVYAVLRNKSNTIKKINRFSFHKKNEYGDIGERRINKLLRTISYPDGKIFNSIIIGSDDIGFSEIDHILVSTKGIFVVETKYFNGTICVKENDDYWIEKRNGRYNKELKFYSPIKQNYAHINKLKSILNSLRVKVFNIVIFASGDITKINDRSVFTPRSFTSFYESLPEHKTMNKNTLKKIIQILNKYKNKPIMSHKQYVQRVKVSSYLVNSGQCPKCGSELIKKQGRYGMFYGCSSYPKCNYRKNIR